MYRLAGRNKRSGIRHSLPPLQSHQRSQRQLREDLNIRRNEELNVVLQIANGVIQDIAKKEGFDLILQEAVYRSDKIDITDMVIKALSK